MHRKRLKRNELEQDHTRKSASKVLEGQNKDLAEENYDEDNLQIDQWVWVEKILGSSKPQCLRLVWEEIESKVKNKQGEVRRVIVAGRV